tara:strand:- start:464 stop:694 length:231 start_codon:yes stop_codon:yes gene_type:complete
MIFKSRQSGCYDTAFYIRSYRRLVRRFMLIALMTMVLLLLCVYYALKRPDHQYFASTGDGRIIPLTPVLNVTKGAQ